MFNSDAPVLQFRLKQDTRSLFVFGRGVLQDAKALGIRGQEVRALQGAVSNAGGNFFEQSVANSLGRSETNAQVYTGMTRNGPVNTVPDLPVGPQYGVTEIKSSANVVDSPQIRAEASIAEQNKVPFNIVIGPDTQSISGTVIRHVEDTRGAIFKFDDTTSTWTFIDPPNTGPWRK